MHCGREDGDLVGGHDGFGVLCEGWGGEVGEVCEVDLSYMSAGVYVVWTLEGAHGRRVVDLLELARSVEMAAC